MSITVAPAPPLPDAPYPGIEPFRFIDQQIFAARDEEIWNLISNVTLYRAVFLYGDSGTGKSSLINAGLLPHAFEENYAPDRLRVQPFASREIKVERIAQRGGKHPTYLPSNFVAPQGDPVGALSADEVESFELSLTAFRQQLEQFRRVEPKANDVDPFFRVPNSKLRPLLIFDQFEEFITLFEEAQRGGPTVEARRAQQQAPEVQRAILKVVVDLIQDNTLPVKIVFSFREDYLAKVISLFDACPQLLDQSQRLLPPELKTLPKIIRAPFDNPTLHAHFLQPEGQSTPVGSELSESLARRIAAALGRHSEGDIVNLTELQIVCQRLWRSSDPETLFKKNGIKGILREYAGDVFGSLPSDMHDEAVALLSHMITGSNTRNIISENDLLTRTSERTQLAHEQLHETLDALCESQLMRRERRRDLHFYELASEYFVPWIKERVAEREAVDLQLKAREARRRLAQQLIQTRRERRRTRLLNRLVVGLGISLIVLIVLGMLAGFLYKRSVEDQRQLFHSRQQELAAEAKAQVAQRQREKYEAAIKIIAGKTDADKLQAIAQIKKWNEEGDFPAELVLLVVAAPSTTENPQIRHALQALSQVLVKAAQTDVNLSQSIGTAADANASLAEKLPPRFYIHVADENQTGLAQKVANALRQQGYVVPGIQNVGGDAPKWDNELRYFRKAEEGMPPPGDILSLLKQTTGSNWTDAYNPRYENSTNIRPGHFEVWFAAPTGQLVVSFVDEAGNAVHGSKFVLSFEPSGGVGVSFSRSRSGYIAVPPGNYDVTIKMKGYKELRRALSMEQGEQVDWSNLKLTKEDLAPTNE